jgi:hypothetical protein
MRNLLVAIPILLLLPLLATPADATTRLHKLSEDRYLLTHQKQTGFGGQGKAVRLAYEKAASLCLLLDYSWFEVRNSETKGRTWGSGAAATFEIKLYREQENEDLNDCQALASEQQKEVMRRALQKIR